jgi:hypothetical protein
MGNIWWWLVILRRTGLDFKDTEKVVKGVRMFGIQQFDQRAEDRAHWVGDASVCNSLTREWRVD